MPRVQLLKLANPSVPNGPPESPNSRYNNGKKQLTGRDEASRTTTRAPRAELCRNSDPAGIGTDPAIKDKVLSAAVIANVAGQITRTRGTALAQPAKERITRTRAEPKIGGFKGADRSKVDRSRSGRRSTALRLRDVQNILAAAVFALEEHRPLNRHTTIHFDKCRIADPVDALGRYTKLARDWLATKGAVFSYIWVREAGDGKGEHAHLLMHVPSKLISKFWKRERGWRKLIGAERAKGAFKSTPVGRSYRHGDVGIQYGQTYGDALEGIVGYLSKGADPRVADALQLTRRASGGELWGKRTGMSENINRTARAKAAIK